MASGWASDGAVNEQIDSTVNDGVARVRQAMGQGESEHYCRSVEKRSRKRGDRR